MHCICPWQVTHTIHFRLAEETRQHLWKNTDGSLRIAADSVLQFERRRLRFLEHQERGINDL